jgi:hypothetical protein
MVIKKQPMTALGMLALTVILAVVAVALIPQVLAMHLVMYLAIFLGVAAVAVVPVQLEAQICATTSS